VTISAAAGGDIYYTFDGSQHARIAGVQQSIALAATTTTINAIAVQSGWLTKPTTSGVYTLGAAAPIAFVQQNYATPQTAQARSACASTPRSAPGSQRGGDRLERLDRDAEERDDSANNSTRRRCRADGSERGCDPDDLLRQEHRLCFNTVTVAFNGRRFMRTSASRVLRTRHGRPLDVSARR